MKFLCIGDYDTVLGFRFAGVEGVVVETPEAARETLERALLQAAIGVIIIPDQIAKDIAPDIERIRFARTQPSIVVIPGPKGANPDRPKLIDLVREAIGVRV